MPITRASSRALAGAARAPSTIYTTYNEIVSIIQGGLPSPRARRVPKRAREEEEEEEENFLVGEISPLPSSDSEREFFWNGEEISPETRAAAENWCGCHPDQECEADCEFRQLYGVSSLKELDENLEHHKRIIRTFGFSLDCMFCDSKFRDCGALCLEEEIPKELLRAMSPLKRESLVRIRLLKIIGYY